MRIADLPESSTYTNGYMPVDIAGATYKTDVENITPNIADNVSTTSEGFVWSARQGKLLSDRIDENTQGIAESDGVVTTGIVVNNDPWTLYQSRDNNTDILYYPRTAKEVLITVVKMIASVNWVFNAIYVPGVYVGDIRLQVAGWNTTSGSYIKAEVPINTYTRGIGAIVSIPSYTDFATKVYYR